MAGNDRLAGKERIMDTVKLQAGEQAHMLHIDQQAAAVGES